MTGCARSCLLSLLGFAAAIAAIYTGFARLGIDDDVAAPAAAGIGFFAMLSVSFFWGAYLSARDVRLLRAALEGTAPRDGRVGAFPGTVRSLSPLKSPITGRSAVAYKYEVYEVEGSGDDESRVMHYEGVALAPSSIVTPFGTFRLFAVPQLDMPLSGIDRNAAMQTFERYRADTAFETKTMAKERGRKRADEWTDDEGAFRRDRVGEKIPATLSNCRLEERMIPQGAQACLMGLYSEARGGIVPDRNWARPTRVVLGAPAAVESELRRQMRRHLRIGLALAAGCVVVSGLVVQYLR